MFTLGRCIANLGGNSNLDPDFTATFRHEPLLQEIFLYREKKQSTNYRFSCTYALLNQSTFHEMHISVLNTSSCGTEKTIIDAHYILTKEYILNLTRNANELTYTL